MILSDNERAGAVPGEVPAGTCPLGSWVSVGAALAPGCAVSVAAWAAVLAVSGLRDSHAQMYTASMFMSRKLAVRSQTRSEYRNTSGDIKAMRRSAINWFSQHPALPAMIFTSDRFFPNQLFGPRPLERNRTRYLQCFLVVNSNISSGVRRDQLGKVGFASVLKHCCFFQIGFKQASLCPLLCSYSCDSVLSGFWLGDTAAGQQGC